MAERSRRVDRLAHYLAPGSPPATANDDKAEPESLPTRAWVSVDEGRVELGGFRCLVEEHRGGHWERYGDFDDLVRWALDECAAEEFYVWNVERRDWDRLNVDDVRTGVQGR